MHTISSLIRVSQVATNTYKIYIFFNMKIHVFGPCLTPILHPPPVWGLAGLVIPWRQQSPRFRHVIFHSSDFFPLYIYTRFIHLVGRNHVVTEDLGQVTIFPQIEFTSSPFGKLERGLQAQEKGLKSITPRRNEKERR